MQWRQYAVTVVDHWTPTEMFWTLKGARKHFNRFGEEAHLFRWYAARHTWIELTCSERGHKMQSTGGMNCGCTFEDDAGQLLLGSCSVPVHHCTRCGDCDYGDNDEAIEIRRVCEDIRNTF